MFGKRAIWKKIERGSENRSRNTEVTPGDEKTEKERKKKKDGKSDIKSEQKKKREREIAYIKGETNMERKTDMKKARLWEKKNGGER